MCWRTNHQIFRANGQEAHLGQTLTTRLLAPGDSEKVSLQWIAPPQNMSSNVKAIIDQKSLIGDCHPENNTAITASPVKCSPLG